ncbi:MAG: nucleotidyl transferase AbiEii/AbiGii toxin family protein [Opitutae bacterium]|nr:nucleotidyl transferase AbiEii/AbiGii toxin family protein [Opitutae bacterium]
MKTVIRLTPEQRAQLFNAAAQKLGIGPVSLEKDFWVCWTLRELFTLPGISEHLIFKGGTSLSKVWRVIQRFSEDIDVSLSKEWLGFGGTGDPEQQSSRKKQERKIEELAAACAAKVQGNLLPELRSRARAALGEHGWSMVVAADDPQELHFRYPTSLPAMAGTDYIAREVKIECGARSDPWPAENRTMQPYVAEAYPDEIRDATFTVRALAIERTFWEKATILHAEVHRPAEKAMPGKYSRHYADLAALADHPAAAHAITRDDLRARVVEHKQVFFASAWARFETAVPGTFRLIPSAERLAQMAADYQEMQIMYFGEPVPWPEIVARLKTLESALNATRPS